MRAMPKQKAADVTGVEILGEYRLRLAFSDGKTGIIDLAWVQERGGVFAPLRDPDYFCLVTVDPEAGTIVWPNGADIAPETLYDGMQPVPEQEHVSRRPASSGAITGGLLGAGALAVVLRQIRHALGRR